ncbi:helix-hairpin-helix domain-containing protein [Desulfosporosinus sp. BG]|uniref:helix-hairpin-helix domain-containing protein n=1 Tax=Desulfosporosinus sp. BG TaxID=1633135 RepID=UPI00083A0395|nr:helix-hairpin-helix domain-containing protein [Desulfosporosinus sp. BG]ODA40674.1 hypothetical protein DSBG_2571 [Desulfosporosinus sp. BG]
MTDCYSKNTFVRNRYFYGKLLTVSDFEIEQRYFIEKSQAVNRLLHGVGVVSGLQVTSTIKSTAAGKTLTVKISEGMALDCCGNLIYVSGEENVEENPVENHTYYFYLKYKQCYGHPQPAPAKNYPCKEECCYGHIEEAYEVIISTGEPEVQLTGEYDVPVKELEKICLTETTGSCPHCKNPDDAKVLIGVAKVVDGKIDNEGSTAEFIRYRSVVYNHPMLRDLVLALNEFALKISAEVKVLSNDLKTLNVDVQGIEKHVEKIDGQVVALEEFELKIGGEIEVLSNDLKTLSIDVQGMEKHLAEIDGQVVALEEDSKKLDKHLGLHLTDFKNPHKTSHNATNPAPADESSDDNTRDKHVSNADAMRWNRSIAAIQVDNVVLEKPGGYIHLKAGENVTLKTEEDATVIVSAAGATATTAKTGRVSIKTGNGGIGSVMVDPGLKESYGVQLGLEFETESSIYVEYAPVHILNSKEQVSISSRVFLKGDNIGKFEIFVHYINNDMTHIVETFTANVQWVAIPAEKVRILKPGKIALTDIKDINELYAYKLSSEGITDAAALAKASDQKVADILEINDLGKVRSLINEAKKLLEES